MTEELQAAPEQQDDPGVRAAHALALAADEEPEHALQVCHNALLLFDGLAEVHGLGPNERRLLAAAALLHDTGWAVDPTKHHKASRDFIMRSKLDGFTKAEHKAVACIARYHRKAPPREGHKVFCDLDARLQEVVRKLAAVLRLADGLDRSHCGVSYGIRVVRKDRKLRLHLTHPRLNPTDAWGAERKRNLFEEVFHMTVDVLTETGTEPDEPAGS